MPIEKVCEFMFRSSQTLALGPGLRTWTLHTGRWTLDLQLLDVELLTTGHYAK